jgi:hypothetical protein
VVLGACCRPELGTCSIRCGPACPPSFSCGADGFCHEPGDSIDCRFAPDSGTPGDDDANPSTDNCMPCELVSQCGCPGQACDITQNGSTVCRATGGGMQSVPCASKTDCANGFTCIGRMATAQACYEFCDNDATCVGPGGRCALTAGSMNTQKVCTTNCNPLTSAGCPSAWGCHVAKDPSGTHSDCHLAGVGGQNASCTDLEDCAPGFACVQFASPRCLKYCVVGGPSSCPGGSTCMPFGGGGITVGGTQFGVCL